MNELVTSKLSSRRALERGLRHAPSGPENFSTLPPRALPWAIESRAFSAGSTRALACCVPRPRGTPEDAHIFHALEFSNASPRPARARAGTREARVLPSGSTGHWPVAPGNLRGATAARSLTPHACWKTPRAITLPFGGSPNGTGESPVLPALSRTYFSAPTGRHSTAQGKALGHTPEIFSRPERAELHRHAPSGLENFSTLPPRALPWAIESRAFSAGSTRALACCVPRPRGTPEDAHIFHALEFSNASPRPARARVGTREARVLPSGSTGHWPVAPGNLPGATAARSLAPHARWKTPRAIPLPFGGSPNGTGASPVPPTTPTALHPSAQGCRVREATLGETSQTVSTLKGLNHGRVRRAATLAGLGKSSGPLTQGSSCVATLGWMMEPRWGSPNVRRVTSTRHGTFIRHDLPKAALKRPHSKRCRVAANASCCAERLECGRVSAAFPLHGETRHFATTPSARPPLVFGVWNLFGVWSLGFGVSAGTVTSADTLPRPVVFTVIEKV